MAEYDLKSAIAKIKDKPLNFGLYRGEDADQVLISGMPAGQKQITQIEKECGKVKRLLKGLCFWEGTKLVFASKTAPAPAWEMMILKILKDHHCGSIKPIELRQLKPNEPDEVSVSETDGTAPGAPNQPQPQTTATTQTPPQTAPQTTPQKTETAPDPQADKARWAQLKAELVPLVKVAMGDPKKKDALTKIVGAALAKEKAGAWTEAYGIFEKLKPLVVGGNGAPGTVPPTSPPQTKTTTPPQKPGVRPPQAGKLQAAMNKTAPIIKEVLKVRPESKERVLRPVVTFQDQLKKKDLEGARQTLGGLASTLKSISSSIRTVGTWTAAREKVANQIAQLQGVMRQSGDDLLMRIADQGLNATTGRLQVGLQVALMEFDSAQGEAKQKAADKVRKIITDFRGFLQSDPVLPLLEDNPLGVTVDIRGALGNVLTTLETAIAS